MPKHPLIQPSDESRSRDQLIQEVAALRSQLAELAGKSFHLKSEDLPESEIRYKSLFNNMTEAFALHEIITAVDGKPLDCRFLEINPAFEQMTGLSCESVVGKTVREVLPEIEDFWIETYGRVALDSTPVRFSNYTAVLGRWHDVFAYCPGPRLFAIVFTDITERKQAEIKLRKSEEKFRNLFNNAQVGMFITRLDGSQVLDMNDRFLEIFGQTREEMLDTPSTIYWADPLERQEMVRQLEIRGRVTDFECKMLNRRGEITQCLASLKLYREQGILQGAIIDITERKRHESEQAITLKLLTSLHRENDLKAMIKDITALMQEWSGCEAVGIRLQQGADYPYFETRGFSSEFVEAERRLCAVDPKGELIRDSLGNPVLECMCGKVISGRGKPDWPFFTKYGSFWTNSTTDLLASTTEADRQARTRNRCHGEGYESVALIPLSAGNQRLGLLQFCDSRRDQFDGRKIALCERLASNLAIGLSQRITALALKESEAKYRSMMEAMEDPTYICSPDFHIEYMNPAMIQWIGRDATGEICHKVIRGIDQKCPHCVHDKVMRGEHVTTEVVSARGDKTYQLSNSPIVHANGSISKLTIRRDVTEIKNIEKRIQQSQKMEAIGALAGGIAHDFNNLLFPISGLAEMLMDDLPSDSLMHENALEIFKAARRAGELVRQILSFSRQSEQKKTPLKIQMILKEVLKLVRATIPSDIRISFDFQNNCGLVMANPTQIHQVIMNLITNAFHAVEKSGGKISVKLSEKKVTGRDYKKLQLEPGRYVLMSISDTGHGIPPAIIGKIFDPYFTTKERGKGTGLGLSTVYGILREHGGDIRVASKVGKGATFDVYLPLIEKAHEAAEPEAGQIVPTGTEKILLVDDEEPIVRLEKQMLERLGYQVEERTSSIEALKAFQANPDDFDLIISDMTMPNMTGDQLAKELMAIKPDIAVIICTGFSKRINMEKAEMIGVKGLLMKPIIRSKMAKMIRDVLDQSKNLNRE